MVFSCLSGLWCNRNVTEAPQRMPESSESSRRAYTEKVALSVQDAYNGQARPPLGAKRVPLPPREPMSEEESSVSWILHDDSSREMEISQTVPALPSTPVMAMWLNSGDGRKDSTSLCNPNNGLDASNHVSGKASVESIHREWSLRRPLPLPTPIPVINGGGQDSDSEDSDSVFNPKVLVENNGGGQDSDSEDSDSVFNPKVLVENREESLVQGGESRSMEEDSTRPQEKEISTPMPFSPRLRPYNDEKMTASPSLSQLNTFFGDAPISSSTVWQIQPKPSQGIVLPIQYPYQRYYSSDEEGD